ncbi:uncharacterized protein LOC134285759 [Aedes albopictus]|uniref:PHD-type domain-containing protein n=1 Tax=Aedes albopictus TaxID=7160 RepID=A0ABM1Z9Z0_AEDAL
MSEKNVNVSTPGGDKQCKMCDRGDIDDNMVCCDICEGWIHFQCAGVTDSIGEPDRSWKCSACLADWNGSSKSEVSFNDSSVSKSSRVSQRLQLSLQLLEEQQKLKKKRAAEELKIRRMEEEAKLKAMDDEQEFLKQKYELLMQIGEEKESSSRKSGVSVRSKRVQLEKWLNKGSSADGVVPPRPSTTQAGSVFPLPIASEVETGAKAAPTCSISNTKKSAVPLNQGMLYADPTIPVQGGSVTALAQSYELLATTAVPGSASCNPTTHSAVPDITVSAAAGTVSSLAQAVPASTSPADTVSRRAEKMSATQHITSGTVPVYSYPGVISMSSAATVPMSANPHIFHRTYGNHLQYPVPTTSNPPSRLPCFIPTNPVSLPVENQPVLQSTSSFQYPAVPEATLARGQSLWYPANPEVAACTSSSFHPIPSVVDASFGIQANPRVFHGSHASVPHPVITEAMGTGYTRNNPPLHSVGPTSAQLAARQVMPRELPKFSGDPQEWPMFYSSFTNTTEVCGYTDAENLARLQRSLGGSALEAVRSRLLLPASVPFVMNTLHKLYGRPEILINSLLKKVRNVPSPKSDNLNSIVAYGLAIQNLVDHIILADQQAHLANPMLLQELIEKLPTSLKMQWGTYKQQCVNVNLATFNSFMSGLVNLVSELSIDVDSAQNHQKHNRTDKPKQKEKLFTHMGESSSATTKESTCGESSSKACSYCDKDGHQILNCSGFKALDIGGRWKAVRQKNLCRLCLIPHRKWPCRSKKECNVEGCRIRHHTLLHSVHSQNADSRSTNIAVHQNHHGTKSYTLFRYLPVTLYGNGKQVETFVFLDDGSSSTLLEAEIATQLGIEGEPDSLWLSWTGKIGRHEKASRRISVKISGANKEEKYLLNDVRTVQELGLPNQTLDYKELVKAFPHLQGLPVNSYVNAKPGMIIGIEHVRMITSLRIREGGNNDPVAAKTRLGWCVYGRNSTNEESVEQLHVHVAESISNTELHDSMRKFFAVEEAVVTQQIESDEDKRARSILETTTVRREGRMEVGLLWRKDDVRFPDSYQMALSRLRGLEKRLAKDAVLRNKVNEQLESFVQKQYVRVLSPEELESTDPFRRWYLPLGIVTNPKKPSKIRMVWDAAAKVGGVCFNDMLLKGPDLLVPLVDVLLRFREGKIAVCSDIREMFLRILIREEDSRSQCFLWRNNPDKDVQVYVINVAMFGATSSPCTAQYAKNRNAFDFAEKYPRAVNAIVKGHYVDDFLDSVNTVDEAVQLVTEVQNIHASAGFQFGKILSNSSEVLNRLGETSPSTIKSLNLDKDTVYERVLGVVWIPSADHFTFDRTGLQEVLGSNPAAPTKRQVLRTVMKLYDPLGFVAHFVVHGKILMQEIWRSGTNWDEPIAEHLRELWIKWIKLYETINEVAIPRCFFGELQPQDVDEIELHVFTDASIAACACVAYVRMAHNGGNWCALVAAKTKVAPLRTLSVPRLELQAAMMGARLLQHICTALTLNIRKRYLWTDSSTVLAWIRSDGRRYHQFVSFRVGEILSLTSVDEWN